MNTWREKAEALKRKLALRTHPVAFKRFDSADEMKKLETITEVEMTHTFCQLPFMARVMGRTIGVTTDSKTLDRCKRLHALYPTTDESMKEEAAMLSKTWFGSKEDALKQQKDYPRMPVGEAIALAPLARTPFEPDVISIYGNPAQIMMIMCGMQKVRYEQFHFSFIGEGACTDSIGRCYTTGRPALAIPCYGERAMGQVADDEIVIALPPGEIDRVLTGLDMLRKVGFKYPTAFIGGISNPIKALSQFYPQAGQKPKQ
ncbi:MAG: hypothetical protein E4H15_01180 [Syntrophobacterales bacterium]|nr:MAG: hypothetical protein E4H15_01180 [Syntrophobacterales bacterium]